MQIGSIEQLFITLNCALVMADAVIVARTVDAVEGVAVHEVVHGNHLSHTFFSL